MNFQKPENDFSFKPEDSGEIEAVVNVTSIVDVVLMLIIFFILTSSFAIQTGLRVRVPEVTSSDNVPQQQLYVLLTEKGYIFFDRKKVEREELVELIKKAVEESKINTLIVRADKNVAYGFVVEVMDIAKRAGIKNLALATKPRTETSKQASAE